MHKNIIEVTPQGYCGGVMQAIAKVKALRKEHPQDKITILGSLVHNVYVNQALEQMGIRILEAKEKTRLELLDEIDDGYVVFTAHGISDAVRLKAQQKGLQILDASCPFVLQTQKIVKSKIEEGFQVLYIGKKGHPEAEAVVSSDPAVTLVSSHDDIPDDLEGNIFVTNQTTMSIMDIQTLFDAICQKYPQAQINDEICNATRVRQQALLKLEKQDIDLLIVVGDPSSNNTRQLEKIGRVAGIPEVIRIESPDDLDDYDLDDYENIAVTSGASTPTILKEKVIEKLRSPQTCTPFAIEEIL